MLHPDPRLIDGMQLGHEGLPCNSIVPRIEIRGDELMTGPLAEAVVKV